MDLLVIIVAAVLLVAAVPVALSMPDGPPRDKRE
jgi:cytochrome c oxidase assembly factor CtaG